MLEETARNVLLTVVGAVAVSMAGPIVSKSRTKQRQRMHWAKRRDGLDERGFKKRYRLSKAAFAALVVKISPLLERQWKFTSNPVSVELRLSMTLRWLAGGHYIDIIDMHGVHESTFYNCLWSTCEAICAVERLEFPDDTAVRKELNKGFLKRSQGTFHNCIGALDGIAIAIRKPNVWEDLCPMSYFNRKKFFALNVQVPASVHAFASNTRTSVA